MSEQANSTPIQPRRFPLLAAVLVIVVVFGCAIYANLSFLVTNRADYRYFPPFRAYDDANMNRHLGAEYYCIARALVAGEGFSSPFQERTGPTAWMPPILSGLLAGLLLLFEGDKDSVMAVVIFFQVYTLATTGIVVLALAYQTGRLVGAWIAALLFVGALVYEFHSCFQVTHDSWIVLLALDVVVAGYCWLRPLESWPRVVAWGVVGGICALVNPIVALVWGLLLVGLAIQERAWYRFAVASLAAAVVLAPWTVRNYLVFGRLVPVKSNLAYELYQSQCLQPDGLIQGKTFATHPYASANRERHEYRTLGEMAFLDRKRERFWAAVRADPLDFVDRVTCRLLGTTVWYVPFQRNEPVRRPWVFQLSRFVHPLPFLAVLVLVGSAAWLPLHRIQWLVVAVYLLYLMPYIAASYYERYGVPLLGVKVLLVFWAGDRLLSSIPWRTVARGPWAVVRAEKRTVVCTSTPSGH